MSGISSKAAGGIQNKYKFNGGNELQSAEFSNGSGMELYDAVHRMYDPQLGRFWQVDELAEANWEMSTYCFASDNPLRFNDPLGLTDADPKDDPTGDMKKTKTLSEVVVSTKIPKLNNYQVSHFYWALQKYGRGTDRIRNKTWRSQVEAYDATAKWLVKYHAGVKEDGMMMLNVASWFIPGGQLLKLRYVGVAVNLFKARRGAQALFVIGKQAFAGSLRQRGISAFSELSSQYLLNVPKYGMLGDNFKNINYSSVVGNLAMPNNGLGQAAFGNGFSYTIQDQYKGIGSGASNGYIITNMVLDYGGNLIGDKHGNFLGDMHGNATQTVFDNYYQLNTTQKE